MSEKRATAADKDESRKRRGLVSLWDERSKQEVGLGYVEVSSEPAVRCTHRWVLDNGYKFAPTGLRYRPLNRFVGLEEADATLSARWAANARLVDCSAETVAPPLRADAPSTTRSKGGPERIELKGVWPVCVSDKISGFILVPQVESLAPGAPGAQRLQGLLASRNGTDFMLQSRYVEHWVMMGVPFPLLDVELVVAEKDDASIPHESTFFGQLGPRMSSAGSYTVVTCQTFVEAR